MTAFSDNEKIRPASGAEKVLAPAEVLHGEVVQMERSSAAFERLHALVRKGYKPEIGTEAGTDIIVLRHLGKAPDLVLHGDGVVEGWEGRRPRHKKRIDAPATIAADKDAEHLRFMKFLETVPKASLRDRTRPWRTKYIYVPAVMIAVWLVCLAFTAIVMGG